MYDLTNCMVIIFLIQIIIEPTKNNNVPTKYLPKKLHKSKTYHKVTPFYRVLYYNIGDII